MQQHKTRKICLLGGEGVGKTSLVRQYVHSIFSEKYLKTIGVQIETKDVQIDEGNLVKLVIWDLEGSENLDPRQSYLRGAAGFIFVIDGTRSESLDTAIRMRDFALSLFPERPYVCVINKVDLDGDWTVDESRVRELCAGAHATWTASAKTGANVEYLFHSIAEALLAAEVQD